MLCPSCHGSKEMQVLVCGVREGGGRFSDAKTMPCSTCRGTGEVADDYAERRDWGQRIRHNRVHRFQHSQREAGEKLRIDFHRYSRIEHGIETPTATELQRIEALYGEQGE